MNVALRCSVRAVLALVCTLTWAFAAVAEGQQTRPEGPGTGRLYARLSLGAATLRAERDTEREGPNGSLAYDGGPSVWTGPITQLALSVGGTPKAGFVVSGTLLWSALPGADLKLAGGNRLTLEGAAHLVVLSPTIDWFPSPSRGFHLGGGLGAASLTSPSPDPRFARIGGQGIAALLHFGYDWSLTQRTHLGLNARSVFGLVARTRTAGSTIGMESTAFRTLGAVVSLLFY